MRREQVLGHKGDAFPSIANFARRSLPFRRLAPGIAFKGFLADCGWIFEAPARRQAGKFGAHDKPPALKLRRRPLTGGGGLQAGDREIAGLLLAGRLIRHIFEAGRTRLIGD